MTRIIAVTASKGGVGKTTTTINLAIALATRFQKKVAIVDCNLTNPHLALHLGSVSSWPVRLNDVLVNKAGMEEAMYPHPSGIHVVPTAFETKDLARVNMYKLRPKLDRLFRKEKMDFVFLDSAPGLSKESMLTAAAAHEILYVATPHIPAIIDVTKCNSLLTERDAKPLGVILNRIKKKGYELKDDEVFYFTKLPILGKVPEDDNVLKSANFKVPVINFNKRSAASQSFVDLAATLLDEDMPKESSGFMDRMRGFFGL